MGSEETGKKFKKNDGEAKREHHMTAAEVEEELVEILKEDELEIAAGYFRGIAAIARAKAPLLKQTARTIGQQRSLAFASEVGYLSKIHCICVSFIIKIMGSGRSSCQINAT
uniref:Uncharacterized protein n=1 Tax=Aplanochytrium stocchinoi TaxID=215587 RepID=A0A6S8E387_9STRA|mmetsp:Transcript_17495/g.21128  ORF Transcript_17495/g.21128 Transcript_17495/m.21128 type:complete len:112 (-) Transcript_17495:1173-1508(-)